MRTISQKVIFILCLAFGLQTNVKAQLVYIPDPNFRNWCNASGLSGCMVGDSIDPSCPAVLNVKYIDLNYWNISDLTGVDVFVNDTMLDCRNNQLINLHSFPNTLKRLWCSDNQLTSLQNLPNSLEEIWCDKNQLTSLPALPISLTYLYCGYNQLTSLPVLPNSLNYLNCWNNQLTSLPTLPDSLSDLIFDGNQLTSLPALPDSLNSLNCSNNPIPILSALPASLKVLSCIGTQITSLPTIPATLKELYCGYSQLTSIPALPSTLNYLFCQFNQLTSLPTLPSSLKYLYCNNNQLTSLPSLPDSLKQLYCNSNQLTSLANLPASLKWLYCNDNQLMSLPSLTDSVERLRCNNNQLANLPKLPNYLFELDCSNNPILCLPQLKYISNLNFSNTLVNCVPNYVYGGISTPSISSLPICDVFNSNGCEVFWNVAGTSYKDIDTNCINNILDPGIPNTKIKIYKNGILDLQTFTNQNGNYYFDTKGNDNYKTEIDTIGLPFDLNCPINGFYLDTISAIDSIKYDRDFALKCKGADLAATSIYTENLRPASLRKVNIQAGDLTNLYGSNCAAGVCGTVSITITGPCNYYSSPSYALTPNAVSSNVLTYYISDFGAISYDSTFDFNLLVDTTNAFGNQICITVNVYTKCAQELNYSNNQLSQCFTVVGSFDPNDKAVYPSTTLDISGNKWLNYTIRFQNTGTAEAEHIYITDTMSNLVDISTFTLLSYSHQPMMQIYNDGLVKFNFPNIHLPDSNTNEPESHGYVQYKIRAKDSLTVGSTIENTANIFFDFNAPVITNTTSNTIINCNIPKTILNATICGGEAYILNGQEYYNTGVYQQNILTAFGCDSVVELRLTVNTINNTITQSAGTLQTTATATNYQWINCTTGAAIVGANTQTFNPTQSGSYSVVVDFGTCKDTSACYYFSPVGINEINANNISIQPNPFNTELKVTLDKNYEGVVEVYNTIGALITSEKLQSRNVTLNTSNWNAGVYILKIATNDGVVVKKVIKR
jgi:hypothetical protein